MLSLETLQEVCADLGVPRYRATQVYEAATRRLAVSFDEVTVLPAALRAALAGRLSLVSLHEVERLVSDDGRTRKSLLAAVDGAAIEAVTLLSAARATVCVSTQVGCAVRCAFCASGANGLLRDLSAGEMVDQVFHAARELRLQGRRVTNVVFMGMGEPFFNYEETLRACRMLNDPAGFGLAARAISVSTAGVVPAIARFAAEPLQLNLAVSLHAATDELRERLVPLNRRYPLDELFAACKDYVAATRRKLFLEWVLLPGVNDGDDQIAALRKRCDRSLYHLNVIGYNDSGGAFEKPARAALLAFREKVLAAGIACTVRRSPGGEIDAACGQLALRQAKGTTGQ